MIEKKLEIARKCCFISEQYSENYKTVSLEYTEHSPDAWYSDSQTSHDIDEAKARSIVEFLCAEFPALAAAHGAAQDQPVARTPLTDEDIGDLQRQHLYLSDDGFSIRGQWDFARAIEAAIPDQTPVLRQALEAFRIVRLCVPPAQRPTVDATIAAIEALGITGEQS